MKVAGLAAALGISAMTIRRDLAELAARGLIDRTYGGAVVQRPTAVEPRYHEEVRLHAGDPGGRHLPARLLLEEIDHIVTDAGLADDVAAQPVAAGPCVERV